MPASTPISPGDPRRAVAYLRAATEADDRRAVLDWAARASASITRFCVETGDDPVGGPALTAAFAALTTDGAGCLVAASRDRIGGEFFGTLDFAANASGARIVCADGSHLPPGEQRCPTCGHPVEESSRYPRALCGLCMHAATDEKGRPLRFENQAAGGGFRALYADTNRERPGHDCYVHGVKCFADEAYFGGIVIQPAK